MQQQTMDRGTDALKAHLGSDCAMLNIRQTRRGCFQELLGCEARTEMKYFVGEGKDQQIATSLEDSDCCCRIFCQPCYPFTVSVQELNTNAELLTVERPCKCGAGTCKCCCYQEASVSSGGTPLGSIKETCYFCVPSFKIFNDKEEQLYLLHPPTCCGGCCVNCCTEGNPCCGKGCCKVPFWVFPADATQTDGDAGKEAMIGKILKVPKSLRTELFTDANAFEVTFPTDASTEQKAILTASALFMNALFFEGDDQ